MIGVMEDFSQAPSQRAEKADEDGESRHAGIIQNAQWGYSQVIRPYHPSPATKVETSRPRIVQRQRSFAIFPEQPQLAFFGLRRDRSLPSLRGHHRGPFKKICLFGLAMAYRRTRSSLSDPQMREQR